MTFIAAQKHMKLPKLIALTCCALLALSGNGLSAKTAERDQETVDKPLLG
jgi:internalin A